MLHRDRTFDVGFVFTANNGRRRAVQIHSRALDAIYPREYNTALVHIDALHFVVVRMSATSERLSDASSAETMYARAPSVMVNHCRLLMFVLLQGGSRCSRAGAGNTREPVQSQQYRHCASFSCN
jgi:hypothetical protein